MATRNFENWLKAYMSFTSDSEAPDDIHFWAGVATIAGALRRRVWIDMRKFQWTPNFYIIFVGPPGIITKSTCMRVGMRLLESVDGIRFGPPSITWQKLADSLSEAVEHMELIDPRTGEKIYHPMSCLTIPVSELGTFLKIDDSALVDVLVDLWDGQLTQWGHSTKTAGTTDIKNPWLNILGCTTPAWLKEHFPDHLIGGGLTSRIVFVYGDKKRRLSAYPDELIPSSDYRSLEQKLKEDLLQISLMSGEYQLSPDAREWGHAWYKKHWNGERPAHMASERYGGYHSRKQTHIHKLAIVLAAARSTELLLTREHLQEAEAILTSAEAHMIKVFESIGMVEEARHTSELVQFVRSYEFLTSQELYTFVRNIMSFKEFEEAIKAAVHSGQLIIAKKDGKTGVVSPTKH